MKEEFAAIIAGAGNYFPIEESAAAVVVTRTATSPAAVAAPAATALAAASPADSRRCLCQAGLCPLSEALPVLRLHPHSCVLEWAMAWPCLVGAVGRWGTRRTRM